MHCPDCSLKDSTASLIEGAKLGRVIGHTSQAEARRRESKRRHDLARQSWSASDHPSWLTEGFYTKEIQPRLNGSTLPRSQQLLVSQFRTRPISGEDEESHIRGTGNHSHLWQVLS